jgi:hypothetical protein
MSHVLEKKPDTANIVAERCQANRHEKPRPTPKTLMRSTHSQETNTVMPLVDD